MARLRGGVLGNLSGTAGNVSFRERNGKTIVCSKTKSFIPGTDRKSVERRERFGNIVRISKAIYSIPELKSAWQKASKKSASAFNLVIRSNLKVAGPNSIPKSIAITPPTFYSVAHSSSSICDRTVSAELTIPLGQESDADLFKHAKARLAVVFSLSDPVNKTFKKFEAVASISQSTSIVLDTPTCFTIELVPPGSQIIAGYQTRRIFFALLISDSNGNLIRHSTTFQ